MLWLAELEARGMVGMDGCADAGVPLSPSEHADDAARGREKRETDARDGDVGAGVREGDAAEADEGRDRSEADGNDSAPPDRSCFVRARHLLRERDGGAQARRDDACELGEMRAREHVSAAACADQVSAA